MTKECKHTWKEGFGFSKNLDVVGISYCTKCKKGKVLPKAQVAKENRIKSTVA